MRRISRITGRSDDMLIIRGVNVFPSQIEDLILREPDLSPHFRLEVWKDGNLDRLDVVVETSAEVGAGSVRREQAAEMLKRKIKAYVGVSTEIKLVEPGSIERSSGKAKRVFKK
jgi:phenylacetate-CoA ligase